MSRHRLAGLFGAAATVAIVFVALWFLHRELAGLSLASVMAHVRSVPAWNLLAASGCTLVSYGLLTIYDAAGLRYLGRRIPRSQSALTSFIAFAVGHNVGVASLSGGSIRYRLYTLAGLTSSEVARLIVFISFTFGLGAAGLLGLALLTMPASQTAILNLPPAVTPVAGGLLLCLPPLYVLFAAFRRQPLRLGSWRIAVPGPAIALTQVGIAAADIVFAAGALFVLLEPQLDIGFVPFMGIFMLALGAGVVSNVPGGVGVFEAVLVAALPTVALPALLGTILLYRLIYYLGPLALALLLLLGYESRRRRAGLVVPAGRALQRLAGIVPPLLGALVFLAGVVLLVSGASPAVDSRLALISAAIPLPVLELSHLGGSVVGMLLLILARGLHRRLRGAWHLALLALVAGIVASLVKGFDYEEAVILTVVGVALWLSRDEFYRSQSLLEQRFSLPWITAIGLAFSLAVWIGLLSYRHVEYSHELWWKFALDANAPRMLRASLVAAVTAISFALWKLLRKAPVARPASPVPGEMEAVRHVLEHAQSASASLALLGDKRFLWSPDREAFIMYQVSGNSWIAMGDPVGAVASHEELTWAFMELVDRHDGRTVFYQVSGDALTLYVDLGLSLSKLGEDATVPLHDFSLQGSRRAELRGAVNRARRSGAEFQVVARAEVTGIMADLRRVSDAWLADKSGSEKGFSLGAFSEDYMACFDCAVVRVGGDIVAFANLWQAPAGGELSIDLMRYAQGAPKGVMDYLFTELMLWGSARGYRSFNLGMAPLSGLDRHALAPLWHKIGHLVFTHGDNVYNFEGLRHYKNKFDPDWQPRYLACPGGWRHLPAALIDVARLISGGMTGIVGR